MGSSNSNSNSGSDGNSSNNSSKEKEKGKEGLLIDAGSRPYTPRGAALDAFYCQAPEVLLDGPAGTGKSRLWLERLNAVAWKYPNSRQLICRKTRASITQTAMVTFEKKVQPENSPVKFRTQEQEYRYPNGSIIAIGGIDQPLKIMSTEYDIVYVMEATELSENDWESLTTRLRNGVVPYQQIVADCNPDSPFHWLNQRCNAGLTKRILSRHEDNPSVTEEYLNKLRSLTGVRRARLYEGKWAAAEGLVYPEWDKQIHLVDRFEIPADWPRYRVIDFGYVHPFTCQWYATDKDKRLYLYRELYGTQKLVEDWAVEIKKATGSERIVATITDHDAEDRATLEKHLGCKTIAAHKDVSPGLQAVSSRLRVQPDGRPRLYIFRDCLMWRDTNLTDSKQPVSVIEEFDSYVWQKGTNNTIKEVPVKEFDHGLDCLRYQVAHLDLQPPRKPMIAFI